MVTQNPKIDIATSLERLFTAVRRTTPGPLNFTGAATLDTLLNRGPARISDLAVSERISQPGMTTLINKLADEGYVEKQSDPDDGRASVVRITSSGKQALSHRHSVRIKALTVHLGDLSAKDQAALVNALPAIEQLTEIARDTGEI